MTMLYLDFKGCRRTHSYTAEVKAGVPMGVPRQMWLKLHIVYFRKVGNQYQGFSKFESSCSKE